MCVDVPKNKSLAYRGYSIYGVITNYYSCQGLSCPPHTLSSDCRLQTAPRVSWLAFTIIWNIQRSMAPSRTAFLSLSPSTYTSSPLHCPNFEKSPGSSSKHHPPSSLLPCHCISQKPILTESISSPCTHSLSHSRLAPRPTPPLKLPSPGNQ